MFKSVYDFTKIFSILFFLSGVFFLFKEAYLLAFITLFSFFIIRFIDSDWAFDNFKFSNHNLVVIVVTFALILVNLFTIYNEMRFSSLFVKVSEKEQLAYLNYENSIYEAIEPCYTAHNEIMKKKNENKEYDSSEIKIASNNCYKAINSLKELKKPEGLNKEVIFLCNKLNVEFQKIAVNLATYDYETPQMPIVTKIKESITVSIGSMNKIREIMKMSKDLEDEKKTFIQL